MEGTVLGKLINLVNENYGQEKPIKNIDISTNLAIDLGLNSIDALELLLKIEDEFGIEIPDEKLNINLLRDVNELIKCIEELKQE